MLDRSSLKEAQSSVPLASSDPRRSGPKSGPCGIIEVQARPLAEGATSATSSSRRTPVEFVTGFWMSARVHHSSCHWGAPPQRFFVWCFIDKIKLWKAMKHKWETISDECGIDTNCLFIRHPARYCLFENNRGIYHHLTAFGWGGVRQCVSLYDITQWIKKWSEGHVASSE